jgi:site-specific DNA-methyltransferase (adenine-specific)
MTDNAKGVFRNVILQGDSVALMQAMPRVTVDFILTAPPYLVNYLGRDGRTVCNDDNAAWLQRAFNQIDRWRFCLTLTSGEFGVAGAWSARRA